MPSIEHAGILDAEVDRAWEVVRRFGDIADWHPAIAKSRVEGDVPDGMPGCLRVLTLKQGGTMRERLLSLDVENRSLTYRIESSPLPVDDYRLSVGLVPVTGEARTFIRWTVRFDVRDGVERTGLVETVRRLVAGGHDALALSLTSRET